MLGSNQRPLPCESRSITSWLFVTVQKYLQISISLHIFCRPCSSLFAWVGVLLVYMNLAATPTLLHLCMVASLLRYTPRVMQQWVSLHGAGIPRDRIWNAAGGKNSTGNSRAYGEASKGGVRVEETSRGTRQKGLL